MQRQLNAQCSQCTHSDIYPDEEAGVRLSNGQRRLVRELETPRLPRGSRPLSVVHVRCTNCGLRSPQYHPLVDPGCMTSLIAVVIVVVVGLVLPIPRGATWLVIGVGVAASIFGIQYYARLVDSAANRDLPDPVRCPRCQADKLRQVTTIRSGERLRCPDCGAKSMLQRDLEMP